MSIEGKKWKPDRPYVTHSLKMLRSDAWRALGKDHNAKKVVERLEIEHLLHGGKDNGRLPCPYHDFVEYGMRRQTIARSIRRAVAYGFVEITQKGRRSAAGANPALYRLTYLPDYNCNVTDEWQHYRHNWPNRKPSKTDQKSKTSVPKTLPMSVPKTDIVGNENGTDEPNNHRKSHSTETGTTFYTSTHLVLEGQAEYGIGHSLGPPLSANIPDPDDDLDIRNMPFCRQTE